MSRLTGWAPAYDLPADLDRATLRRALAEAEALLAPADRKAALVLLERLFRFARTFGVKMADVKTATAFYLEALDDLPADLLARAVDDVVRSYRYGHRLPPPGDLRAAVADAYGDRIAARHRIDSALRFGREPEKRAVVTEADRKRALELFDEVKRLVAGNTRKSRDLNKKKRVYAKRINP